MIGERRALFHMAGWNLFNGKGKSMIKRGVALEEGGQGRGPFSLGEQ